MAEETGVRVRLGRPLPEVSYRLPDGRQKRVSYWVGRPYEHGERTAPAEEIDDQRWVLADEAHELLVRGGDHRPLDRLLHLAARDRLGHAGAGRRCGTPARCRASSGAAVRATGR